jgi:hypothetical protein
MDQPGETTELRHSPPRSQTPEEFDAPFSPDEDLWKHVQFN